MRKRAYSLNFFFFRLAGLSSRFGSFEQSSNDYQIKALHAKIEELTVEKDFLQDKFRSGGDSSRVT